jgi:hypothetical protein
VATQRRLLLLSGFLFLQRMKTIAGRGSPLCGRQVTSGANEIKGPAAYSAAQQCWGARPAWAAGGAAFPVACQDQRRNNGLFMAAMAGTPLAPSNLTQR